MQSAILILSFSIAAPALKEPPNQNRRIVGEWVVEKVESVGRRPGAAKGELRYCFAENGTLKVLRNEVAVGGESRGYRFDPDQSPATIDLIADVTDQELTITRGIYKIQGDRLTLVLPRGRSERPKGFEVSPDVPGTLYVMRRVPAR